MELQIKQFWILKGHSTINSANEYEPDEVNTGLKTQSFLTTNPPWVLHPTS